MMLKNKSAFVLQPLDAMIRLKDERLVSCVAVGVQNVYFAVAVEIHELDAGGAVSRVWASIEFLGREMPLAVVEIGDDDFMFLADEDHRIEVPNRRMAGIPHRLFELGILFKGIDGALELAGGFLLLFLSPAAISGLVFFFIRGELKEDPTDLVANLLLRSTPKVIQSRTLASTFLLVHGIAKLLLVAGLLSNQLWSYPAAVLVFGAFAVYQLYQLAHQYSFFLGAATVLDIIVIVLIVEEYRHMKTVWTR